MLMEVKNQIKVIFLSVKYNIMKQMLNKVTFITNIIFMILNNASFFIQWIILFSLKDAIGGYTIKEVMLLWGIASSVFGVSHIFFYKAFELPDLIMNGKLDSFLVQPKNIFLSVVTSATSISAIGDLAYGYICLFIYGINLKTFFLFTLFSITGGIILSAVASILGSISFWTVKGDLLVDSYANIMVSFATYPGSIFKFGIKILFYTIIPVGLSNYLPVDTILHFDIFKFLCIILFTIGITLLAFYVFYLGLKRYSSSNLMSSRV